MRIAINAWFWDSPGTGSGQYTRRLVEHLAALAPDLEILLVAPGERRLRVSSSRFQGSERAQRETSNLKPETGKLSKVWFEQIGFPRACRRLGVDVAHVPYWAPPLHPPVPTVVTIHDLIPLLLDEYRGGPLVRLYTALVSASARRATLVLTDSEASRRDIVTRLGLPDARVRTVYLAAGEQYTPAPPDGETQGWDEVRARYRLPERYVLYLGGFDVRKNVATALATYRWAGPVIGAECPLVVAGRLPEQDTAFAPDPRRLLREWADIEPAGCRRSMGPASGDDSRNQVFRKKPGFWPAFVRFIGFVREADKPALYRGAVAFLFPSRYEGFGLPPLEACACGVPVVGSDVASIPEVVGHGGVLLPPDDAQGMAEALIQLATDDGFRSELSRRALAQAARFSWERTAGETLLAYRGVVASHACRGASPAPGISPGRGIPRP